MRAPSWTDRNDADPGVTLLALVAWLALGLLLLRRVSAGRRALTRPPSRE